MIFNFLLFFCFCFFCFSSFAEEDKQSKFLSWFHKNGGVTSVGLSNFPSMGRGIVLEKELKEKDQLYFIPSSMMFSIKNLSFFLSKSNYFTQNEAELLSFLINIFKNDEELVLISWFLLEHMKKENSFFYDYFSLLPSYIPSLVYFQEEELTYFDRQFTQSFIKTFRTEEFQRYSLWKNATESFTSTKPTSENLFNSFKKEDYFYALTIFSSRALRISGEIFLAPFADMINYAPHPNPRQASSGQFFLEHHILTSDGLSILSDRAVKEIGEQVFEDYGDNSNDIYLRYHSFVPFENPHNCVNLKLSDFKLTKESNGKTQEKLETLVKTLKLPMHNLNFCLGQSSLKLSMATKAYLSILTMSESDFMKCYEISTTDSTPNWSLIQKVCDFNMRMIEVEQDVKKLENTNFLGNLSELKIGDIISEIIKLNINNWTSEGPSTTTIEEDESTLAIINKNLTHNTDSINQISSYTPPHPSSSVKNLLHKQVAASYTISEKKMFDSWCLKFNLGCSLRSKKENIMIDKEIDKTDKSLIDPVFKAQLEKFNHWFSSHLPSPSHQKIKAVPLPPPYRVGTVAIKPIDSESIYLGVPKGLIMSSENALVPDLVVGQEMKDGELVDKIYPNNISKLISTLFKKFNQRDDFHELLLTLIYEKFIKQDDSYYSPYLNVLPKKQNLDIPLYWSEEFLTQEFTGSVVKENILKYQKEVESKFKSLKTNELINEFFTSEAEKINVENPFNYDNYRWATAILDSRSIWWNGRRHLVPLLDFVNCQFRESKVHSTLLDESQNFAITKADQNYVVGEEVTENYGQPSYVYLIYHGFTLLPQGINLEKDTNLSLPDYECVPFSIEFTQEEIKEFSNHPKVSKFLYSILNSRYSIETCLNENIGRNLWAALSLKLKNFENFNTDTEKALLLRDLLRKNLDSYHYNVPSTCSICKDYISMEKIMLQRIISNLDQFIDKESKKQEL